MFVRDFIHVAQPFEAVAPRFVRDTSWLAPIAEEAALVVREVARALEEGGSIGDPYPYDGNGNGHHNGNGHRHVPALGSVRCEVGPLRARSQGIVVPMWLVNVAGTTVMPDLSGDLEVAPVGADRSVIALGATYRRTTGEREALLRVERATEAGVRTFLGGIAEYLARPLSTV